MYEAFSSETEIMREVSDLRAVLGGENSKRGCSPVLVFALVGSVGIAVGCTAHVAGEIEPCV